MLSQQTIDLLKQLLSQLQISPTAEGAAQTVAVVQRAMAELAELEASNAAPDAP